MRTKHLYLLLAAPLFTACLGSSFDVPDTPSDPATETFASGLGVDIPHMTKTAAGDYYKDITVGTGDELTSPSTSTVEMDYAAFLKDGTLWSSGSSSTIGPLNLSTVVFGLQDGMTGMKVGGERLIVVPSALGLGNALVQGVPPNSTEVWDVRLDEIM